MASRYQEIADDLRSRVETGEFPVGATLPPIADLVQYYEGGSVNTIRRAQRVLIDEGLLDVRHGVGVFVISDSVHASRATVVDDLRTARSAINRALAHLERDGTLAAHD